MQLWANDYYASEVSTLAIPSLTGAMATKAAAVAKVPSFQWLDRNVTVDTLLVRTLSQIRAANKAGANPPCTFSSLGCLPPRKHEANNVNTRCGSDCGL